MAETKKQNKVRIRGYSERGVLNSLFYEAMSSKQNNSNLECISTFLNLAEFPCLEPKKKPEFRASGINIFIEQSFSTFGNADAVLLVENRVNNHATRHVIFIEAKVKMEQRKKWNIMSEFQKFVNGIDAYKSGGREGGFTSNLFTQLYHKVAMAKVLKEDDDNLTKLHAGVDEGVFLRAGAKKRKIGGNKVVIDAAKQMKGYLTGPPFFVAIVPEEKESAKSFYMDILRKFDSAMAPLQLKHWDVKNWGFITWGEIEKFCCEDNRLSETCGVFKFNSGQIY